MSKAELIAQIVEEVMEIRDKGKATPYVTQLPKTGNWGEVSTLWPVVVAVDKALSTIQSGEIERRQS